MSTFTIDENNNITAYASAEQASQGDAATLIHFESLAALTKVAADWPLSRLVEIWNSIPGQSPVKKFQDRKKAVARVWKAIQPLASNVETSEPTPEAEKPKTGRKQIKAVAKPAKEATGAEKPPAKPKTDSSNKKGEVIAMMKRAKGATLGEIMEATQWQKHTVRLR